MIKVGIDLGNGYTKFQGVRFASKTKLDRLAKFGQRNSEIHEVGYKEKTYIVGDGELFTEPNRYFSEDYEVCLLTAIGLSSKDISIDAEICVGLPVIPFMSETRTLLEKKLNDLTAKGKAKITINGMDKLIKIKKATVFVEGAYVIETMDTDNIITIDIGAGTINIIQWDNLVPISYDTVPKSFNKLYRDIAKHIQNTGRGTVTPAFVEDHLNDNIVKINGKDIDISDTKQMIAKYVSSLVSTVYDICDVPQAKKIQILGGGALATANYWSDAFGNDRSGVEIIPNSQFTNSEIFQQVLERGK